MADSLNNLAKALFSSSPPLSGESGESLLQKLHSNDAIRSGLNAFYSILQRGVEPLGDDGALRLQSWTTSQIHAISSFAYAIVSDSRCLSVGEKATRILVPILQQSVEFALSSLEKFEFHDDDHGTQDMIHLLGIALLDEIDITKDMVQPTTRTLVDMLPVVDDCGGDFVEDYREPTDRQYPNSIVSLSQHWAVNQGKCTPRLIFLCSKLADVKYVFDDKEVDQNFQRRLSLILSILKILGSLIKDVPIVENDASLVRAVASFAKTLSHLFRVKFEFGNTDAIIEGSFESSLLRVLPEFLHNVEAIFGDGSFSQNIQACIIASILGSLDSSAWNWIYDKSTTNLKLPLAYFPRFVHYTLELINDLKRQRQQVLFKWKDFDEELVSRSTDSRNGSPSCLVHLEFALLEQYTFEELLKLVFPESSPWINNLIQLALFLYSEGLKLRPKIESSYSSLAKVAETSEVENAVCHEDEDLFGYLFSETARSVGSTDACEQPAAASVSSSCYQNLPIQVAAELLNFLKTCIFSKEWSPSLFKDACTKLNSEDIEILFSLFDCLGCCPEESRSDNSATSHEDRKIRHNHELCSEILLNLHENEALSKSLNDYLAKKLVPEKHDLSVPEDLKKLLTQNVNLAENEDMMGAILSRLPVKDLIRFKAVSKLLQTIISRPCFCRAQLQNRGLVFSGFIHQPYPTNINYITSEAVHHCNVFSFLPGHENLVILASCQGLVLCHGFSSQSLQKEAMYVCNVVNKQYIELPASSCGAYEGIALVFDLDLDSSEGFIQILNKLKLVRVKKAWDSTSSRSYFTFDLYPPEIGEWRTSDKICYSEDLLYKNKGIYIGGVLHWLTQEDSSRPDTNVLLTFDINSEQPRIIGLPIRERPARSCIGECEGKLYYFRLTPHYFCAWYLDNADNSMKLKFDWSFLSVLSTYQSCVRRWNDVDWVEMDLLGFQDGFLLMKVASEAVLYDINKNKMVQVCSFRDLLPRLHFSLWFASSLTVFAHSGSLVPLTD